MDWRILVFYPEPIHVKTQNTFFFFSLNIFYLPIKQTKWIKHKLNKLMKSSPNYNMLQ
jgi:hypothetical protein